MKRVYHRIYFELYLIIKKFNPDTAFFTASLMTALLLFNIATVYGFVRMIFNNSFEVNRSIGIAIAAIIFLVNQLYFVATGRYKKVIKQYKTEGNTTIVGWIYILISVALFFLV